MMEVRIMTVLGVDLCGAGVAILESAYRSKLERVGGVLWSCGERAVNVVAKAADAECE